VHNFALTLAEKGLIKEHHDANYAALEQELMGIRFKNPLGLAAGFDKNATALSHWSAAGFGFVEIGTVTYHPQPGNPKPRMFRLSADGALINRLGFNNDGAKAVAQNIANARTELPFGVNIGKSMKTPLENAAQDYTASYQLLSGHGAYVTVNVSSPNTPGLRSLQEKEKLTEIIGAMQEVDRRTPLFVKVAPDLETSALDEVIEVAHDMRVAGLIATNTTIRRDGLTTATTEAGGLSGKPLKELSNLVLSYLYKNCDPDKILIGVGGIFSGADMFEKISLGAHLCQVYTGWVYGGPNMVPQALEELSLLVHREGLHNIAELRGTGLAAR
jgi:dihydroorotate dehydrogenase